MPRILVVEDDESMRLLMREKLSRKYDVTVAGDGEEALCKIADGGIDIIVADVMMPRMDGYEMVKNLRDTGYTVPVILATARQSMGDKRDGFAVGADDYMTKPVDFDELVWRIDALLRRARISSDKRISLGSFVLDADSFEARYKERNVELTRKEFELLFKLLSYPNRLFSKDRLMSEIWGYDCASDDTTIRTHINRLRNKFAEVTEFEIVTVKGLGYKAVINK